VQERHYETLAIAGIVAVVLFALLRQCWTPSAPSDMSQSSSSAVSPNAARVVSSEGNGSLYDYILDVIRHGSNRLNYPGGVMEGGYLPPEEAPKVACYVMELGGHRCPHAYPSDAQMFYTSVCGGCHGDDGKGLHGSYPDLTRPTLRGYELWKRERRRD
jgi:mono/diheme cytochrome c family protein